MVPVTRFENDDAAYEAWLRANPEGFVINARRHPSPAYLKLHRATCAHISTLQPGYSRWTSGDYLKICGADRTELVRWAVQEVGSQPENRCGCLG
jgi:hypothetical protein